MPRLIFKSLERRSRHSLHHPHRSGLDNRSLVSKGNGVLALSRRADLEVFLEKEAILSQPLDLNGHLRLQADRAVFMDNRLPYWSRRSRRRDQRLQKRLDQAIIQTAVLESNRSSTQNSKSSQWHPEDWVSLLTRSQMSLKSLLQTPAITVVKKQSVSKMDKENKKDLCQQVLQLAWVSSKIHNQDILHYVQVLEDHNIKSLNKTSVMEDRPKTWGTQVHFANHQDETVQNSFPLVLLTHHPNKPAWASERSIESSNKSSPGFWKTTSSWNVNLKVPRLNALLSLTLIYWMLLRRLMCKALAMFLSRMLSFLLKNHLDSTSSTMMMSIFSSAGTTTTVMANSTSKSSATFFSQWARSTLLCWLIVLTSTWAEVFLSRSSSTTIPEVSWEQYGQLCSNAKEHVKYWE